MFRDLEVQRFVAHENTGYRELENAEIPRQILYD